MPRNPGVSNVRTTAFRSISGSVPPTGGPAGRRVGSRIDSQVVPAHERKSRTAVRSWQTRVRSAVGDVTASYEFDLCVNALSSCFLRVAKRAQAQSQNDWINLPPWGIVRAVPTGARNAEVWRYGAVNGRAAHARRDRAATRRGGPWPGDQAVLVPAARAGRRAPDHPGQDHRLDLHDRPAGGHRAHGLRHDPVPRATAQKRPQPAATTSSVSAPASSATVRKTQRQLAPRRR